jgi:hypothetical protein
MQELMIDLVKTKTLIDIIKTPKPMKVVADKF